MNINLTAAPDSVGGSSDEYDAKCEHLNAAIVMRIQAFFLRFLVSSLALSHHRPKLLIVLLEVYAKCNQKLLEAIQPQPYLNTFSSRRAFEMNCENLFSFIKS
uniref:Uncharacterized protein n=1 Tax=Glossina palpalis gambiensis TaxID=67801 RepID=A0A1B0B8W9_9MUSC